MVLAGMNVSNWPASAAKLEVWKKLGVTSSSLATAGVRGRVMVITEVGAVSLSSSPTRTPTVKLFNAGSTLFSASVISCPPLRYVIPVLS